MKDDVRKRMLYYAGCDGNHAPDKRFALFQKTLASICAEKAEYYGDFVGSLADESEVFALIRGFAGVEDKARRAKTILTKIIDNDGDVDREKLIECYTDIANYAVLNLMVIEMLDDR